MSYGPQLPPHLRKSASKSDSESEDEDDQSYGPKLPSVGCRGPAPKSGSDSEDDDSCYGPKLPEVACRGPAPSIGPQIPSGSSGIGPQLPPAIARSNPEAEAEAESSDDEMIGPMPPKAGQSTTEEESIAKSIEARAQKMKDRLEGREAIAEPKRESWMLELPTNQAKNFGLGPRSFSRSTNPKAKQDKSWTATPNDGNKAAADGQDPEQDEEVLAYMASLERDSAMEKLSSELNKKRGNESLLDLHTKKLKKKKKDKKEGPEERRPFDRNTDLQVNRFDDAQKKAMLKKAANLDSRFAHGAAKYH